MRHGIAILSASCLFNDKKTVTLREVITKGHWTNSGRQSSVLIVRKDNGNFMFVHGAGGGYNDLMGKHNDFIHDQRRTRVAGGVVVEQVVYSTPEDAAKVKPELLDIKAPIWVLK